MKNKAMLEGKELGAAIAAAMDKKNVGPTVVAAVFGIKPPSVSDWKTRGCVKKNHLPKLIAYFSDVVGPEHWGLNSAENFFAVQPNVQEPTLNHLLIPPVNNYKAALDTLAAGLSELDMAGRERIAPMFESFARSPGPVSTQDILEVLRLNRKSGDHEGFTLAA